MMCISMILLYSLGWGVVIQPFIYLFFEAWDTYESGTNSLVMHFSCCVKHCFYYAFGIFGS